MTIDYKSKHRRILSWYIANSIGALLLTSAAFVSINKTMPTDSFRHFVNLFFAHILTHLMTGVVVTTYVVIIVRLYERFQIINNLLRCFEINPILITEIHSFSIFPVSFRSQLLNKVALHKQESIAFVKQMGRLHNMLCEAMDKLNFCYAVQVFLYVLF